jgi:hypothetical protein
MTGALYGRACGAVGVVRRTTPCVGYLALRRGGVFVGNAISARLSAQSGLCESLAAGPRFKSSRIADAPVRRSLLEASPLSMI